MLSGAARKKKILLRDEIIKLTTFSKNMVNHRIKAITYSLIQAKYLLLPKLLISLIIIKGHCPSFQPGLVYEYCGKKAKPKESSFHTSQKWRKKKNPWTLSYRKEKSQVYIWQFTRNKKTVLELLRHFRGNRQLRLQTLKPYNEIMTETHNQRFFWEGFRSSWSQLPALGAEDLWLMHNLNKNSY